MPTFRVIVRGRVQGVGYRAHFRRTARLMGVTGKVWNRRDGAVEALAAHADLEVIQKLSEALRQGPGRIDEVQLLPDEDGGWTDFWIVHGE
jgi:acylphosphatase